MVKRWTEEEMDLLRTLHDRGDLSLREIGARLGRSAPAIQDKAQKMGLGPKAFTGNRSAVWSYVVKLCADRRPRSVHELAQLTGASRGRIDKMMRDRRAAGQAHHAGWQRHTSGWPSPRWLPFPGKDVPRPAPISGAERQRDRMRRMKEEDPLRYKAIIERTVIRRRMRDGIVTPQHEVVRAMFGMGKAV